jgi:hypothetical protein
MKRYQARPSRLHPSNSVRLHEVPQEIKDYLNALVSYPQRFAQDPGVSFAQHFFSIAARQHAAAPHHE